MDVFSKSKRSEVMAAIRHRDTRSTERCFAALLRSSGIAGWKLNSKDVLGKPDFYFPAIRTAVFVDGCFWHGCPKCFKAPKQNAEFWERKINGNRQRDGVVKRDLGKDGIKVIRLWEHDIEKRTHRLEAVLSRLKEAVGVHL